MSEPLDIEAIRAYLDGEYLRDGYEAAEDRLYRYCKALMIENTAFRAANTVLSSQLRYSQEQRNNNMAWVASESAANAELHAQLAAVPVQHIATLTELALCSDDEAIQLVGKIITGWLYEWKVQP